MGIIFPEYFGTLQLGTAYAVWGTATREVAKVAISTIQELQGDYGMKKRSVWIWSLAMSLAVSAAVGKTNLFVTGQNEEPAGVRLVTAQARDEVRRPVGRVLETMVTATLDKDWPATSVNVVYSLSNGVQQQAKMDLVHNYTNNQIYTACIPSSPIRFKIEASRPGAIGNQITMLKTTDDNNGQWYGVQANSNSGGYVAGAVGGKIALRSAANQRIEGPAGNRLGLDYYGLSGEIFVQAPVREKSVSVVYTEDSGATWTKVPATFKGLAYQNPNIQIWSFQSTFKWRGERRVEFYVVYDDGSVVCEDNNFDYNYVLKPWGTLTVERW